jgi:hypothetical protein
VKGLLGFIKRELRIRKNDLDEDIVKRLTSLSAKFGGHDFPSKLRRYVKHATSDDAFDDDDRPSNNLDRKLEELAREVMESRELLEPELTGLLCEDSHAAVYFAYQLGKHDPVRSLLPTLLKVQESCPETAQISFLAGYLFAIHEETPGEWESLMLSLAEKLFLRSRFADLVISSGMSLAVSRKVVEFCRSAIVDLTSLKR